MSGTAEVGSAYTLMYKGAVVTVEVTAPPDSPRVAHLEAARRADVAPVSHVSVRIDDTKGGDVLYVYELVVHTDGRRIAAQDSDADMLEWWRDGESDSVRLPKVALA